MWGVTMYFYPPWQGVIYKKEYNNHTPKSLFFGNFWYVLVPCTLSTSCQQWWRFAKAVNSLGNQLQNGYKWGFFILSLTTIVPYVGIYYKINLGITAWKNAQKKWSVFVQIDK
jgi:hypothetical protein